MSLFPDAKRALEEIRASELWLEQELRDRHKRLSALTGHRDKKHQAEIENHQYEWVRLVLPLLASGNPRCRVTSDQPGSIRDLAKGYEGYVNHWSKRVRMAEVNEAVGTDVGLDFGAFLFVGGTEENEHPEVFRLSPQDVVWDPHCYHVREARWVGHKIYPTAQDLNRMASDEPGWDAEHVRQVVTKHLDNPVSAPDPMAQSIERVNGRNRRSDELCIYEIYLPTEELEAKDASFWAKELGEEITEDNGYHGIIKTYALTEHTTVAELRRPRPYKGHKYGPYEIDGATLIPDNSVPLSPTIATRDQSEILNSHTKAILRSMNSQKNLVAFMADAKNTVESMVEAEADGYLPIENHDKPLRDVVMPMSLGGASAEQLQAYQFFREVRDRNMGVTDMQRGLAGSGNTATEAAIADQAHDTATGFLVEKFRRMNRRIFERVLWWAWHNSNVAYRLSPDDINASEGRPAGFEPMYVGGESAAEAIAALRKANPELEGIDDATLKAALVTSDDVKFEDLDVDVQVYSMAMTDSGLQQARLNEQMALVPAVAQTIANFPFVKGKAWTQLIAEVANYDGLDELFDWDKLAEFQTAMMQGAMESKPEANPFRPHIVRGGASSQRPTSPLRGNLTGGQLSAAAQQ